jgi:thymidylate synthase (FAD)
MNAATRPNESGIIRGTVHVPEVQHVLDHGYVKLIDSMGTDASIVEAARMSTGRGFVSWDPYERCKNCSWIFDGHNGREITPRDRECQHAFVEKFPRGDFGLLDTLYSSGHSTPFEMCELAIEVQAPIMVFREWWRHRTQSVSEFSARYSQMPNLHYLPELSRVQKQSKTMKQGSGEALPEAHARTFIDKMEREQGAIYANYNEAIEVGGIANELARINTPVSRYSKARVKTDLRNWLGFLQLRLAPNAQYEIRQYAEAVARLVEALWPNTWQLFNEHTLGATRLSRTEMDVMRALARKLPAFFDSLRTAGAHEVLDQKKCAALARKFGVTL